jgi:hypothetical protein
MIARLVEAMVATGTVPVNMSGVDAEVVAAP